MNRQIGAALILILAIPCMAMWMSASSTLMQKVRAAKAAEAARKDEIQRECSDKYETLSEQLKCMKALQ